MLGFCLLECLDLASSYEAFSIEILRKTLSISSGEPCLDFLDQCFQADPTDHLAVDKLLQHAWMKEQNESELINNQSRSFDIQKSSSVYSICSELRMIDWYTLYSLYHDVTLGDLLYMKQMESRAEVLEMNLDLELVRRWVETHALSILEEILVNEETKEPISKYVFNAESIREYFDKNKSESLLSRHPLSPMEYMVILCKINRSSLLDDHLANWIDGKIVPDSLRSRIWRKLLGVPENPMLPSTFVNLDSTIRKQISVDVPRCHQYYVFFNHRAGKDRLAFLLRAFLSRYGRHSCYWQGEYMLYFFPFLVLLFVFAFIYLYFHPLLLRPRLTLRSICASICHG